MDAPTAASAAMARYSHGEQGAFEEVYQELAPRILALLRRAAPDLAEDLCQDTFLAMHRARGAFVPGAAVEPWAFAIARHLLVDALRRQAHRKTAPEGNLEEVPASAGGVFEAVAAAELVRLLRDALARLPALQAETWRLLRLEEWSLAEVAAAQQTSISAVKSRSHRAYGAIEHSLAGVALRSR